MKFDMGHAWSQAMAMVSANKDLLLIIAGIFIFLPTLAMAIFIPEMSQMGAADMDPDDPMAAVTAMYAENWPIMVILSLFQAIGTLALFALFAERRPTVGEALKTGLLSLIPYFVAYILFFLVVAIVLVTPIALLGANGATAIAAVLGFVAFVAFLYLIVKVSLLAPVIVIDRILNPIKAIIRSWKLTKGNSLRLFLFFVLLVIALIVVAMVVGLIATLIGGLLGGGTVAALVTGSINGVLGAVWTVIFIAVISSVHRQLSGPSAGAVRETFE